MNAVEQQLYDALISEAVVIRSTSNNLTPAQLKQKTTSNADITKLIRMLSTARATLFARECVDNGASIVITIGRPGKIAVRYVIQRIDNPARTLKEHGINSRMIVDRNGDRIRGPAIGLVDITSRDQSHVTKPDAVRSIIRQFNRNIPPSTIGGVAITSDNIDQIITTITTITRQSSDQPIIRHWANLVNGANQSESEQDQQ